jgi:hypothetical protein
MIYQYPFSEDFIRALVDEEEREELVADQARTRIALQIRALREQPEREWSQTALGHRAHKPQSVISRIENIAAGRGLSLQTLLDIGAGFELPLLIEYVEWEEWFDRMYRISASDLRRTSFNFERLASAARAQRSKRETIGGGALSSDRKSNTPSTTEATLGFLNTKKISGLSVATVDVSPQQGTTITINAEGMTVTQTPIPNEGIHSASANDQGGVVLIGAKG